MCIEDIRLGRATFGSWKQISVSTTGGVFLPANIKRVGIIFLPPPANTVHYTLNNPPAAGEGIVISAGGVPFELDIRRHGNLCVLPWYAIITVAVANVSVFEFMLEQE